MERSRNLIISVLLFLAIVLLFSAYTVAQYQTALKFQLGEIISSDLKPGLHFKIPLINNVRTFDARIQTLEAEPERYLTKEKKNVIVDSFVKWKIADVERYYTATGGDDGRAGLRLYQIVKAGLRSEFGKRTIQEVVSGDRAKIMDILTASADQQALQFGIDVVDVRVRRVDLPKEVSQSVYQRMQAERARIARDLRARGSEAAERITADADRQRTVLLAEASSAAEAIRGEGDGVASATYAKAYGKDPEFYSLYRSLNAYKNTFNSKSNLLVLEPDSAFFKYFKDPLGAAGSTAPITLPLKPAPSAGLPVVIPQASLEAPPAATSELVAPPAAEFVLPPLPAAPPQQ